MSAKVMLIEDDATMVMLLRTLLQFEGYEVADLGDDSTLQVILDHIQQEQPAVILMDVHLRQVNGIDLLEAIRKDELVHSTGVIMSSGSDMRQRCLEQGADAFILKPYMPDELMQNIKHVLARRN
jgi:DNA-binding response OmpR family regulator